MDFVYSYIITLGCFTFNVLFWALLNTLTPFKPEPSEGEKRFRNAFVVVSMVLLGFLCYDSPELMLFLSLIVLGLEIIGGLLFFLLA